MKTFATLALVASSALAFAPAAQALVLNFDDLPDTFGTSSFFVTPYNGFSFGNLNPLTNDWGWNNPAFPSSPFIPHSAPTSVATDASLYPATALNPNGLYESQKITASFDFKLNSAYFAGFPTNPDNSTALVYFKLYDAGNNLVHTSSSLQPFATPQILNSGYAGSIRSFTVFGPQGFFVMDDVNVTPVPEVGTYAMMLAGLAAVGAVVRRRRAA